MTSKTDSIKLYNPNVPCECGATEVEFGLTNMLFTVEHRYLNYVTCADCQAYRGWVTESSHAEYRGPKSKGSPYEIYPHRKARSSRSSRPVKAHGVHPAPRVRAQLA